MNYVVMVRGVNDEWHIYGPVRDLQRAESFASWFNIRVEKYERENPDESDGVAWAYVEPLSKLGSSLMMEESGLRDLQESRSAHAMLEGEIKDA